jgi:hypothetical protein
MLSASDELRAVVERSTGAIATLLSVSTVRHVGGDVGWEGPVYIFELRGHPSAARAFAWSYSNDRNPPALYVVLQSNLAPDPSHAVRMMLSG